MPRRSFPLRYQPQAVRLCGNVILWRSHTLDTVGTTANYEGVGISTAKEGDTCSKAHVTGWSETLHVLAPKSAGNVRPDFVRALTGIRQPLRAYAVRSRCRR